MSSAAGPQSDLLAKLETNFQKELARGAWQAAVQARATAASIASMEGKRKLAGEYFDEAIRLAAAHGLRWLELSQRIARLRFLAIGDHSGLIGDEVKSELRWTGAAMDGKLARTVEQYSAQALADVDALAVAAGQSPQAAGARLTKARDTAMTLALVAVTGRLDDAAGRLTGTVAVPPDLSEEIRETAAAMRAETLGRFAALRNQMMQVLADTETDRYNRRDILDAAKEQQPAGAGVNEFRGATVQVMEILNGPLLTALLEKRYEEALRAADKALQLANSPRLRRAILEPRAAALYELRRFDEAEAAARECGALIGAELDDASTGTDTFDDRTMQEEIAHLMQAFLLAKRGRNAEAWDAAERGRGARLKRELGIAGEIAGDFRSLQPWLRTTRSAVVSFGVIRWGTLVLTAGPDEEEPQARILPFTGKDLKQLLGLDADPASAESATLRILASRGPLSAALIHPLAARIREITQQARTLCILPYSGLYNAPFAGLTLEDAAESEMLVDLCALAMAPSAAVLRWSEEKTPKAEERDCLVVGAGSSEGIDFRDDAAVVAKAGWKNPPAVLLGEAATPSGVAAAAPHHTVLFFSCHGGFASLTQDLMAASQLELADEARLSARDVMGWKINADLVFLSACLAGRFQGDAGTDVNGFVKAFLMAGSRSLIAPLIKVDPGLARDMAGWFFESWLGGATKAGALRAAQIRARERYREKGWETFWLFWNAD